MKKIFLIVGLLLTGSAVLFSCKRDDDDNPAGTYSSLVQAMKEAAPKASTFIVDAAVGGVFYGNRCTYTFPPGVFRTLSGGAVTGNVLVEVLEILKPGDMLYSRILPVSNGQPLVSGGELKISATQNGAQLRLADGVPMQIKIPQDGNNASGMDFFTGTQTNDTAANIVNWDKRDQGSVGSIGTVVYMGDTVSILTDSMGLVNADRFLNNPNYQTFTVAITGVTGASSSNTFGYCIYDQYNGSWPMNSFAGNIFSENHVPNIPVHFVIFSVVNGVFYGGITGATPANGNSYTVTMAQTTPAAFKELVDAL